MGTSGRRGQSPSRTLLTPQGDGNVFHLTPTLRDWVNSPAPSLPRKGTETRLCAPILPALIKQNVPHPPYPARGRKHRASLVQHHARHPGVPHPPYPARGRKPGKSIARHGRHRQQGPAPSLPRKGTETVNHRLNLMLISVRASRTLLTPQGDGNSRIQA